MDKAGKIDVSELIDGAGVGRFQIMLFVLCALSLIMDGFDVQSMGYVAPAVIPEFGMSKPQLGDILSAANAGVLIGSLLFTMLADKIGRRPVLVYGTFFYALITLLTANAHGTQELLWLRFIGGIGMGSIIPNASALIGEYSPRTKRITLIMGITVGFTAGAAIGGLVAGRLIPLFGWRSVFYLGGVIPLIVGTLMVFWLPESLEFLVAKGKHARIARWVARIDPRVESGPETRFVAPMHGKGKVPVAQLLTQGRAPVTLLYWLINFTNLLNLYFLAGLLPTILKDHGYSDSSSATIGGLMQLGGTIGTYGLIWFIAKRGMTPMLTLTFFGAAVSIALIGTHFVIAVPWLLTAIVFIAGWCVVGGQPGLNALGTTYYPTFMRSTGVGWGLGIGRIGAIIGPWIGSRMLGLQWSTQQLFFVFALPAVVSTVAMLSMHYLLKAPQQTPLPLEEEAA